MASDGERRGSTVARTAGRAAVTTAGALGAASRSTARAVRRATHAEGAGETGLGKLIEMHAVSVAGDALVTLSLAGTLFFSVPVGEARGRVALYLLVTMAPFAVVAPVIGPVLDRLRHGRRWAIAATLGVRAVLAFVLAGAVEGGGLELYPAAFGLLLCSKAYGVTRSATVPRLLPPEVSLVRANSRISLSGIIAAAIGAAIGAGLAWIGSAWPLRLALVLFATGAVLAVRLPRRVDSAVGEQGLSLTGVDASGTRPRLRRIGPSVVLGLRANAAIRAFSGFLTLFLAFLLRKEPFGGVSDTLAIGLVVAGAGIGQTAGTSIGAWLKARTPEVIIVTVLLFAAAASVLGAWLYALPTVVLVGFSAGLAQSLGKLSLDALIQREIPEAVRTSAFARSETLLQLSWVLGGAAGIVLPLRGDLGLGLAALGLVGAFVVTLRSHLRLRRPRPAAAPARR